MASYGQFYNLHKKGNDYVTKTKSVSGKPWLDEYELKDGYESRYLGNGDNAGWNGALATYTNDFDDLWDSYEPMRDRSNYGIFQTNPSATTTAAKKSPPPKKSTGKYEDIIGKLAA